jgi:uncharacterized protein with von Willebrand factor type A (vWA) domain
MSNSNLYGKSKTKKMSAEIDPKYLPPKQLNHNGNEIPWSNDPNTIAYLRRYAENAKQSELNAKLFEKQREEELREMEEREKRQREESGRRHEANAKTLNDSLTCFFLGNLHDITSVIMQYPCIRRLSVSHQKYINKKGMYQSD